MTDHTSVQLDPRTRTELQPPCDLTFHHKPCPCPATFVFRTGCPACTRRTLLLVCTTHVKVCVDDAQALGVCRACRRPSAGWAWSTEPLL